jgi:hypothetical protein
MNAAIRLVCRSETVYIDRFREIYMTTDVKLIDKKALGDIPPLDKHGTPTTYLSFLILKRMFSQASRWFTSKQLTTLLGARFANVDMICRQLKSLDLISENTSQHEQYR